jgi:glutathione S-transferase
MYGCALQASKPGSFVAGDKISHGDLALFCMLSTLKSGWLDGG